MSEARPEITDEMVRDVATTVLKKIYPADPDGAIESAADDLVRHYRYPMDGYELALELNRYGWDVSRDEMEELDGIDRGVRERLKEAEAAWFAANPVEPPFPIGTKITHGLITGIYEYEPARYLVKVPGTPDSQRRIIKFEDARESA